MHHADAYQRFIRLAQQKGPDYVYKLCCNLTNRSQAGNVCNRQGPIAPNADTALASNELMEVSS